MKAKQKTCACGCGEPTGGTFAQGHDRTVIARAENLLKDAGFSQPALIIEHLVRCHLGLMLISDFNRSIAKREAEEICTT